MANTVIALKKSSTPSAQPTSLANGELAINYSDGKLFYKHANGTILPFNTTGGNAFGTINANGTLVVAGTSEAVVSLIAGNNITITADAINDTITFNCISGGDADISFAYDKANSANLLAYNTGIGANAFTSATIAGANTAVGTGANAFTSATVAGANTAVGIGANSYAATVGSSANSYLLAVIAGANTAVGTGANAFTSATVAGANTAVGAGANAFASATIAGANTAVGAGANAYTQTVGAAANAYMISTVSGANTAVGIGANSYAATVGSSANSYLLAVIAGANTAVGTGAKIGRAHV